MTAAQTKAQRLAERVQDLSSMFKTPSHERGICNQSAFLLLRQDELLRQALEATAYWLEHGETPGAHDMIQRTHDAFQERLK